MEITPDQLEVIVKAVVSEMGCQLGQTPSPSAGSTTGGDGVFATMDQAIAAAVTAQRAYLGRSLADRRTAVAAIREVALRPENLQYMAEQAVAQTGMGDVAHKVLKNKAVAENTPGVEDLITDAWSGDDGLTTVEFSPFGVIGAITPTTNPTETIINNGIGMLAAGNSVVFSVHPRAKDLSLWLIRELNRALVGAGLPPNLIVTVTEPSIENTQAMMKHPDIRMLVATGGPAIVKTVMSSGKKAIGAGAGNPPAVVDETADLTKAARDIVDGSSFDNNLPCTAEKEVVVVDRVADLLIFQMEKNGAYLVKDPGVIRALESLVLTEAGGPKTEWVGKPAAKILAAVGIEAPLGTRLVIMETPADHPFAVEELMMPILPIIRVKNVDEAIELAIKLEHGNRHTAVMHSTNVKNLTKMAKLIQTTIFVKNGPSYSGIGIGGEGFTSFTLAGPTGEGLTSARTFARRRRCVLVGDLNVR